MSKIVFATGNPNKIKEVKQLLGETMVLASLDDINCTRDLPETSATIEGNALQKARYVYDHFQVDCFSEDTGLEIDSLNGEPGVYSARYAGLQRDANANMNLALERLKDKENRGAQFKTVMALIFKGKEYLFEGIVRGEIITEKRGTGGFGYDPVFLPDGFEETFGEMASNQKNEISHRGRALRKLIAFLKEQEK